MVESFPVVSLPIFIRFNTRGAIDVIVPIDRFAFVAVQPGTVCTKGEEDRERYVSVVPRHSVC